MNLETQSQCPWFQTVIWFLTAVILLTPMQVLKQAFEDGLTVQEIFDYTNIDPWRVGLGWAGLLLKRPESCLVVLVLPYMYCTCSYSCC